MGVVTLFDRTIGHSTTIRVDGTLECTAHPGAGHPLDFIVADDEFGMVKGTACSVGKERWTDLVLQNKRTNVAAFDIVKDSYCGVRETSEVFLHVNS